MTNWDEAEDVTAKYLPDLIKKANDGNAHAKRRLLDIFCAMVDASKTPYPELLGYLSQHISEALNGKDAALKLGKALLGGPANRLASPETEFIHEVVAWEVAELRSRGMLREDAVSKVVDDLWELGLDDDAILKAYKKHSKRPEFKWLVKLLLSKKDAK